MTRHRMIAQMALEGIVMVAFFATLILVFVALGLGHG